jgi:large subunit ribosomal protein L22
MEAKATLRYVRMSPRKIRRVAALIRGRGYTDATAILAFTPKAAGKVLLSTMNSAAANAISREGTAKIKVERLFVKKVSVDGGPVMKRIRPVGMGRAYRIRKRTAHVSVVLAEKEPVVKSPDKEA